MNGRSRSRSPMATVASPGTVVEIQGLQGHKFMHLNGKRGTVLGVDAKHPDRVLVELEEGARHPFWPANLRLIQATEEQPETEDEGTAAEESEVVRRLEERLRAAVLQRDTDLAALAASHQQEMVQWEKALDEAKRLTEERTAQLAAAEAQLSDIKATVYPHDLPSTVGGYESLVKQNQELRHELQRMKVAMDEQEAELTKLRARGEMTAAERLQVKHEDLLAEHQMQLDKLKRVVSHGDLLQAKVDLLTVRLQSKDKEIAQLDKLRAATSRANAELQSTLQSTLRENPDSEASRAQSAHFVRLTEMLNEISESGDHHQEMMRLRGQIAQLQETLAEQAAEHADAMRSKDARINSLLRGQQRRAEADPRVRDEATSPPPSAPSPELLGKLRELSKTLDELNNRAQEIRGDQLVQTVLRCAGNPSGSRLYSSKIDQLCSQAQAAQQEVTAIIDSDLLTAPPTTSTVPLSPVHVEPARSSSRGRKSDSRASSAKAPSPETNMIDFTRYSRKTAGPSPSPVRAPRNTGGHTHRSAPRLRSLSPASPSPRGNGWLSREWLGFVHSGRAAAAAKAAARSRSTEAVFPSTRPARFNAEIKAFHSSLHIPPAQPKVTKPVVVVQEQRPRFRV